MTRAIGAAAVRLTISVPVCGRASKPQKDTATARRSVSATGQPVCHETPVMRLARLGEIGTIELRNGWAIAVTRICEVVAWAVQVALAWAVRRYVPARRGVTPIRTVTAPPSASACNEHVSAVLVRTQPGRAKDTHDGARTRSRTAIARPGPTFRTSIGVGTVPPMLEAP